MAIESELKPRITGYGNGPHIYGAELVGTFFDGAALTITVGNLEANRLDDRPKEVPDLAISGRITLTPAAAANLQDLIAFISNNRRRTCCGNSTRHCDRKCLLTASDD